MGTGGSLRLLSPEIVWLFSSLLSSALQRSPRLRFSRTFKTAQDSQAASLPVAPLLSGSACASPFRPLCSRSLRFPLAIQDASLLLFLRFPLPPSSSPFLRLPCSSASPLAFRSSPRPISITKLHRVTALPPMTYLPGRPPRGLTRFREWQSLFSEVGFTLRCLQRLSSSALRFPAVPLARQQLHQRCVHSGPLVLGTAPHQDSCAHDG